MPGFEDTKLPMKKVELKCPNCQADLTQGSTVGNIQSGTKKSLMIYIPEKNYFDYDEYDFQADNEINDFECIKCGADVSEVIKRYI